MHKKFIDKYPSVRAKPNTSFFLFSNAFLQYFLFAELIIVFILELALSNRLSNSMAIFKVFVNKSIHQNS